MTLIGFLMFLAPLAVSAWAWGADLPEPTDEQAAAMAAGFSVMLHSLLLSP